MHQVRLEQAFENIIVNGAESHEGTGRSPLIHIHAQIDKGDVIVQITDRGCGMNHEDQHASLKLFKTSKSNGHGLGLPIVKKIIESEHGGTLSFKSIVNEGTTAVVRLPVEQVAHG